MSPFEDKSTGATDGAWRVQVHAAATQKLAQALAAQEAIRPATNALEFQHNLSQVIERLAHEELALIENMTGMDLLDKLAAAQSGNTAESHPLKPHNWVHLRRTPSAMTIWMRLVRKALSHERSDPSFC
jgi:hypothetical protein